MLLLLVLQVLWVTSLRGSWWSSPDFLVELHHRLLSFLLLEKRVNLSLRLALLLVLLRSPSMLVPLFWLRGSEIMTLGCQAVRNQRPLLAFMHWGRLQGWCPVWVALQVCKIHLRLHWLSKLLLLHLLLLRLLRRFLLLLRPKLVHRSL